MGFLWRFPIGNEGTASKFKASFPPLKPHEMHIQILRDGKDTRHASWMLIGEVYVVSRRFKSYKLYAYVLSQFFFKGQTSRPVPKTNRQERVEKQQCPKIDSSPVKDAIPVLRWCSPLVFCHRKWRRMKDVCACATLSFHLQTHPTPPTPFWSPANNNDCGRVMVGVYIFTCRYMYHRFPTKIYWPSYYLSISKSYKVWYAYSK